MTYEIQEIEGIGPAYGEKLIQVGIKTTNDLLEQCCNAKGREYIASRSGLSTDQLLKWANMADLMRISGVGSEFSELLEAAGVDTVKELRNRRADNLWAKMREVNDAKKLTRAIPGVGQVEKWVEQAKSLAPMITH